MEKSARARLLSIILLIILTLFLFITKVAYALDSNTSKQKAMSAILVSIPISADKTDMRVSVLEAYLASRNSPLTPSAKTFVTSADKYQLDWRLIAAISGVESTFGQEIPYNSYNAWGWGIYGDNTMGFASFDDGIQTISKALRETYIDKWGAENVYAIGKVYAASPTWASRVVYFMESIKEFELKHPAKSLSLSI